MYRFSKYDIKEHFEKNKTVYLVLLFCFFLGLLFGIVIAISKASFYGLLNISDKNFIDIINGKIAIVSNFWNSFSSFLLPLILIFLLSLNYFSSFINFAIFIYQSMLLFLTLSALISSYSFLGALKAILIILPINIIYFFIMAFWIASCFDRVKIMHRDKSFFSGFNNDFKLKIYICLIACFLLSLLVGVILPIILKSAIFVIF